LELVSIKNNIKMTTIKIVGVPEHFNLPWHLAIENDRFNQQNIDLQWTQRGLAKCAKCYVLVRPTSVI
jgi:hypothetical protein